tara:strand:- start:448 stop:1230 length:783 start_codon:yes stop_codon:yes gene_type:complete
MKLTKLHLFLLIIVVLLLSTLGFSIKEYFEGSGGSHSHTEEEKSSGSGSTSKKAHTHKITIGDSELLNHSSDRVFGRSSKNPASLDPNPALEGGSTYDPFRNSDTTDPLNDNDYSKTIAGLEDIVVPGRGNGVNRHHDDNGEHMPGAHMSGADNSSKTTKSKLQEKIEKQERKMATDAGVDMSKYILKSEIVPPVCPKCPDSKTCPALARQKPCPACPPCGRCPEPAFECKKVPNYSAISAANAGNLLPMPRLNSFASFN